ncbi:GNAT family N-acetyltransferase [Nocardioides litoris]|uniref:GNAT family N-acetyltransferase n=1 Tax=Nocardioides litoris TaxID=1926648 RepID=UPI001B876247|nr:GNAT family N-acetyltransferase [Nocardioides litoris]
MRPVVRVEACEDEAALGAAAELLAEYRGHYAADPAAPRAVLDWLVEVVGSGMLAVVVARDDEPGEPGPVGLATTHVVPATLALGRSWQLRDLYVRPSARRRGVAGALVAAVRTAAEEAGATRLSLVTEDDNQAALRLYAHLGFAPVEGLTSLGVDLRPSSSTWA